MIKGLKITEFNDGVEGETWFFPEIRSHEFEMSVTGEYTPEQLFSNRSAMRIDPSGPDRVELLIRATCRRDGDGVVFTRQAAPNHQVVMEQQPPPSDEELAAMRAKPLTPVCMIPDCGCIGEAHP